MSHHQGNQDSIIGGARPDESSARDLHLVQGLVHGEEAAATATSASSSSYALMGATAREAPGPMLSSFPQIPREICSPPTDVAFSESSQCHAGSSIAEEEGASLSQDKVVPQIMMDTFENDELDNILRFLVLKCQSNEQITMEEVVNMVDYDSPDDMPVIFRDICECMRLGFGIITKEVDSTAHTYELVSTLGLSYSGILDDTDAIIPKADLLILILSVIFLKGKRVSEEYLRGILRQRKMLAERVHIALGDPWKFIKEDLVRAEYLVYQQVPNSDPPCYEFLWGPRALAETTQKKVLRHASMFGRKKSRPFPVQSVLG